VVLPAVGALAHSAAAVLVLSERLKKFRKMDRIALPLQLLFCKMDKEFRGQQVHSAAALVVAQPEAVERVPTSKVAEVVAQAVASKVAAAEHC
jgi:hypothetical protein